MKTISAREFKARGLTLLDDVQDTREQVVITKRGKPVAKLVPAGDAIDGFIGRLKGRIEVVGDIESPIEPAEVWGASR